MQIRMENLNSPYFSLHSFFVCSMFIWQDTTTTSAALNNSSKSPARRRNWRRSSRRGIDDDNEKLFFRLLVRESSNWKHFSHLSSPSILWLNINQMSYRENSSSNACYIQKKYKISNEPKENTKKKCLTNKISWL